MFEGATAKLPMAWVPNASVSEFHVSPASVVFQNPPEAKDAKMIFLLPGTPCTSVQRPLIRSGPTLRHVSF